MNIHARFITIIVLILLFCSIVLSAPNSKIHGLVKDAASGDVLPGANVFLDGTALGSASDLNGQYVIHRVPPGMYTLRVSFIGYKAYSASIHVKANADQQIDIQLDYDVIEAGSVEITAQREGQVAAINQQLTASTIMNVVSSDRIQELPDANAAESIGRISGVSIRRNAGEGQQVIIRGLEPKLNTITVNGVRIPSSDSQNRSVDLSMISPDILSSIEVFKAPTPDMDAESFGGTVNLVLKEAPDGFQGYAKITGGLNHMNSDWNNVKANTQISNRVFDNRLGIVASAYYESRNRGSDIFTAQYDTEGLRDEAGNLDVISETMSLIDQQERRKRWGGSLNLDVRFNPDHIVSLTNFYSKNTRDIYARSKAYNVGTANANTVSTAGTATERSTSLQSNGISGEHRMSDVEMTWGYSRFATRNYMPYNFDLTFRENSAFDQTVLDAKGHPSTFPDAAYNNWETTSLQRARMTQDTVKDVNHTSQINFEIPLNLTRSLTSKIKFGGKYTKVDKKRVRRRSGEYFYYLGGAFVNNALEANPSELSLTHNGMISMGNFYEDDSGAEDFLNGDYELAPLISESRVRDWYTHHNSYFTNDRDMLGDLYDVKESIAAGYFMATLNYGQSLMILPGVRYESSDNEYQAVYAVTSELYGRTGTNRDTTTTQQYDEWLPHLHMKIKPTSTFDIRLSATKTLARPDFSYIAPRTRIDTEELVIRAGNPNLKHAKSWNFDAILSYYHNWIGLITVGGFYKDIQDIFYRKNEIIATPERSEELGYVDPIYRTGYELRWFTNSKEAKVWGYEFDLQTQLRFLPAPLNGLVLNANYSRFYSETFFPQFNYTFEFNMETFQYETTYEEFFRKSQMPGQADQIANIALGYDIGGFMARISVFYQGSSLYSVGAIEEQDLHTKAYWRWDASFKQEVNDHVSLFLNLVNFTDRGEESYFGANNYPTRIEYFGMMTDFGVQYTF